MAVTMLFFMFAFMVMLNMNGATKVNIEAILNLKHLPDIFDHDELWGFEFVDQTINNNNNDTMIKVNVVIEESKYKLIQLMENNKNKILKTNMIYSDIDIILKQEKERLNNRTIWKMGDDPSDFFTEYRNWTEYTEFINDFVSRHPLIATQTVLGQTLQGNNIPLIKLTSTNGPSEKPTLYIQAEVHAREWIANAAVMYIMNAIGDGYNNNNDITDILDNVVIYIAPTINIDGYIYAWDVDRFWRKNRRLNAGGSYGVDLNRNYASPAFCQVGASTNPTSNTYCGTGPLSEPETLASATFIQDLIANENLRAFMDQHTSGPLILYPWGWTNAAAPDQQALHDWAYQMELDIFAVHGHRYEAMPVTGLYPCAGTAVDYAYLEGNDPFRVFYSTTFEGRGPGFNPPPSNILLAGEEQLPAILTTAKLIMQ